MIRLKPPRAGNANVARRCLLVATISVPLSILLASCGDVRAGASASESPVPSDSASTTPSSSSSIPVDQLAALLAQQISLFGGSDVVLAQGVATTRSSALGVATPGDDPGQDPKVPVFLLQVDGTFTGGGSELIPAGAKQIPGTELMVVVSARTFDVLDVGLNSKRVGIAGLGSTFALPYPVSSPRASAT